MSSTTVSIDMKAFWQDPYPALASMRASSPVCFVPELDATLVTKHEDISTFEKMTDVFSSEQPGGLMTVLMGENLMRKDGDAHKQERIQMNPSVSPAAVANTWRSFFEADTKQVIDELKARDSCDLVTDYAMRVSGHALRRVTGLTNMTPEELDAASQGMIDGIANYAGLPEVEAHCHSMTRLIDEKIDEMMQQVETLPEASLLRTLTQSGQPMDSVRANIKLAISGGQNEPRDAIAGTAWALLQHEEQLQKINNGANTWRQAFEEYARWMSPIGMSPRRIASNFKANDHDFTEGGRAFLMFGSGNRDESVFEKADEFDITRDNRKTISFGAGPHFCAGAWISRCLIGDVALPALFNAFPNLRLPDTAADTATFGGWAFRGPLAVPVSLT